MIRKIAQTKAYQITKCKTVAKKKAREAHANSGNLLKIRTTLKTTCTTLMHQLRIFKDCKMYLKDILKWHSLLFSQFISNCSPQRCRLGQLNPGSFEALSKLLYCHWWWRVSGICTSSYCLETDAYNHYFLNNVCFFSGKTFPNKTMMSKKHMNNFMSYG